MTTTTAEATAAPEGRKQSDQPFEAKHRDDMDWEVIRWPGETGKMLFHPRPERPTEPNAGILRLEPGAHHPHPPARLCPDLVPPRG